MGKIASRIGLDLLLVLVSLILIFVWFALWAWISGALNISPNNPWDLAIGIIGFIVVASSPFWLYMFKYRKNYAQKVSEDSSSAGKFAMALSVIGIILGIATNKGNFYPALGISIFFLILLWYSRNKRKQP